MPTFIREYWKPGVSIRDKSEEYRIAGLSPEGDWWEFHTNIYVWRPVELVAETPDAIADYAQELRDRAPEYPGSYLQIGFGGMYSTLDRLLVVPVTMYIMPRVSAKAEAKDIGPLPSVRFVFKDFFQRCLIPFTS